MSDLDRLVASTGSDEGYKAGPYQDTKKLWTFGEGRCLETHPLSGAEWKHLLDNGMLALTIIRAGADWLMRTQLLAIEKQLSEDYSQFWWFIGDARQNALIEMAFQMGVEKEEAFHVTLAALRDARYVDAKKAALDSDWARETPARAARVAEELATGEFTPTP